MLPLGLQAETHQMDHLSYVIIWPIYEEPGVYFVPFNAITVSTWDIL